MEALRVDHANHFLGLRLNDLTSLVVFVGAVVYLIVRRPRTPRDSEPVAATEAADLGTPAPDHRGPDDPSVR